MAHLWVCVYTGGCPFVSELHHCTLVTLLLHTAEPPHSSPVNINDGTACPHHSLLTRHVHGYSQHQRQMCRLQQKCTHSGSHVSSPHHATLYPVCKMSEWINSLNKLHDQNSWAKSFNNPGTLSRHTTRSESRKIWAKNPEELEWILSYNIFSWWLYRYECQWIYF